MTNNYGPLTLPCDYNVLDSYITKNKVKLTEHVVTSVYHALKNNLSSIEVFKFKKSEYVVMLEKDTYKQNIDNIFEYYLKEELYELCDRVQKLKIDLENYEKKQTKKRHKSKNSPK